MLFCAGATLIQGATFIEFANCSRGYVYSRGTFIPDSRVTCKVLMWKLKLKSQMVSSLGVSIQIVDMDIPYLVDLEDQKLEYSWFQ